MKDLFVYRGMGVLRLARKNYAVMLKQASNHENRDLPNVGHGGMQSLDVIGIFHLAVGPFR